LGLIGGILEHCGRVEAGVWLIGPHPTEDGCRMGGWFDAGHVECGEGFDVAEDGVELGLKGGNLLVAEGEAGKVGDVADIHGRLRHGRSVGKQAGFSKSEVAELIIRVLGMVPNDSRSSWSAEFIPPGEWGASEGACAVHGL
jgi:hypothetical protein